MSLKTKHHRLMQLKALCRIQANHAQHEAATAARAEGEQKQKLEAAEHKVEGAAADWERLQHSGSLDPQFAQAYAALLYRSEKDAALERETLRNAQIYAAEKRLIQSGAQAQAKAVSNRARQARVQHLRRQDDERLDTLQILQNAARRP